VAVVRCSSCDAPNPEFDLRCGACGALLPEASRVSEAPPPPAALLPAESLREGDVVGDRFEVERAAFVGGRGVVYRAVDRTWGAPVALKLLAWPDGAGASRFARETALLRDIDPPRVVRYVSHGTTDAGAAYLAMEWIDGESLEARLARGPLGV